MEYILKKLSAIAAILLSTTLALSACGGNAPATTPSESAETPALSLEQTEDASSRITHTEADMPVNTPENQALLDQYVYPFAVCGLFSKNYGPGNHEELGDSLLALFDAFRHVGDDPTDEVMNGYDGIIPQDVVESTLTAHFELTPLEIRELCADKYDAEQQAYLHNWGLGGGPIAFYITDSIWDGGMLHLSYDLYGGDYENLTDTFRYALMSQGKTQIQVDGDNYKFISNENIPQ